jgi:phosphate transport system substrate-binding protein
MRKQIGRWARLTFAAVAVVCLASPALAERIAVGGAGAATEYLRRLGMEFQARTGIEVEVVASMGSSGALRAAADGVLDVAVSGRALTAEATAKGLSVAFTVRTPFVFATSHPAPQKLTLAEIVKAFKTGRGAWSDGEPMRVILRPKLDGDTAIMEEISPNLGVAIEEARRRPDVPIAATDQDNAALAERTPGSLVGTTWLQVKAEKRNLRLITVDGTEPTLENLERGAYPYVKNLSFVLPPNPKPAAERFLAFVRSSEGEEVLRRAHGY